MSGRTNSIEETHRWEYETVKFKYRPICGILRRAASKDLWLIPDALATIRWFTEYHSVLHFQLRIYREKNSEKHSLKPWKNGNRKQEWKTSYTRKSNNSCLGTALSKHKTSCYQFCIHSVLPTLSIKLCWCLQNISILWAIMHLFIFLTETRVTQTARTIFSTGESPGWAKHIFNWFVAVFTCQWQGGVTTLVH